MSLLTPQLIIEDVALPQTDRDRFQCYPVELGQQLDMISGRRVLEVRGHVQRIVYSYDFLPDSTWRALAVLLRSRQPLNVTYWPDDEQTVRTGIFIPESVTPPTWAFGQHGIGYWHNIAFTLREVRPHD